MELLVFGLRLLVGAVLIGASFPKFADLDGFRLVVADYDVLAPAAVPFAAVAVPIAEAATGTALIFGIAPRAAAVGAAVLVAGFTAVILRNLFRGRTIACGCLGSLGNEKISWSLVVRDVALVAFASLVAARASHPLAVWTPIEAAPRGDVRARDALAVAVAVFALLVTAVLTGFMRRIDTIGRKFDHQAEDRA